MSCKIYANVGVGHENNYDILEKRIIAAAQCNADTVVINKSTPHLVIPQEKQYVSIQSKWGSLPYLEVAKRSELNEDNTKAVNALAEKIGIPLLWSVTDSVAAEFVKEHTNAINIKLHVDSVELDDLVEFTRSNFKHITYHLSHEKYFTKYYDNSSVKDKRSFAVYHTTTSFPPKMEELQFSVMKKYINQNIQTGYEGREAGIFPALALGYMGIDYIEKYLGEPDSDNPSVLTPAQFFDMWNSMSIMSDAL